MSIVPSSDFSASQYLYQYDKTVNRLDRYIKNASPGKRPLLNLHGQIQMEYPPPSFTISPMCLPYHWWVVHWLCNIWGNTIDYLTAPISNLYPHNRLWRGFSKTMDCPWWKTYRLIFNIAEYPDNGLLSIPQPWPHIPIFVHVHARISETRTPHSIVWNTIRPFQDQRQPQSNVRMHTELFFMNMLITWIRYASGLQCFVTLLPTGVVSGMSPLMLINFQRATTNFFCFWNCNIGLPDGSKWWRLWPSPVSLQVLISAWSMNFQIQEQGHLNNFYSGKDLMRRNWWRGMTTYDGR